MVKIIHISRCHMEVKCRFAQQGKLFIYIINTHKQKIQRPLFRTPFSHRFSDSCVTMALVSLPTDKIAWAPAVLTEMRKEATWCIL